MENQLALSKNGIVIDITNDNQMTQVHKFAALMAEGRSTVPKHLQGNLSDCMAVSIQAMMWGMSPHIVAQKTHLVNGTLGYEAQLVNAVITSSTAIEGRFHYEYSEGPWIVNGKTHKDPNDWVRVGAVLRGESEITWGQKLYPAAVATKNSPLWTQSGAGVQQQAGYLAVKYWARQYTPHVIMGVYTPDEVSEPREIREINPTKSALNIPDQFKNEVVDTETGEVLQADIETGETLKAFDDVMINMIEAKSIDELKFAASADALAGIEQGSDDYKKLLSFYKKKLGKFKEEIEIMNSEED